MVLPDNIIPYRRTTVDTYGRIGIGTKYRGYTILARFEGEEVIKTVLYNGRANIGRGFKGRECDVYIMREE
jgi:hypothetical protein